MKTLISGAAIITRHGDDLYLSRTNVLSLRQWMNAFGFDDCTLILPFRHVQQAPQHLDKLDESWTIVELLDTSRGYRQRKQQAAERLNALNPRDFGLVYCRMPAFEAWWTYRFAQKHKIPVLTELHGDWKEAFVAQPAGNPIRKAVNLARAAWAGNAFSAIARDSIGVSCIGPKLKELYVPEDKPTLITTNHTVAAEDYFEQHEFGQNDPRVLVFIGEMQKRKGLHVLLESLNKVRQASVNFRLLIFGNGPQEQNLRHQAAELGIADKIEFRGYVANGEELFAHLQQADAFVLPSIAAEGVPRANHEAMAMGCPVIATDIGSTDWQLRDRGGLLVKPNDVDDLADKLVQVLTDPALQKQLSENGLRNARNHSYELQSQEIARFVSGLLEPGLSNDSTRAATS